MNDYEFACFFQAELERHLRETSDQDYRLNPPQALAFATLVRRVREMADEFEGRVEPIKIIPRLGCGSVTATLPLIDLCGSALRKFGSILQYASALSIDALTDGNVCISLNVPDVYVPKTSS